jgi:hypothetical protein
MAASRAMIERIVIETETPGDSRTMFRVEMDRLVIGENPTAAHAHLIAGEVLDELRWPGRRKLIPRTRRPAHAGETSQPCACPPGQERTALAAHFSPVTWEPLIGAKAVRTTMDSKVTALERAFQLARSGHMATVDDIRKRLKQEGYDERAVVDGGRSLTTQLRGLIRAAGADARSAAKM